MKRRKANAAILLLAAILFVNAAGAKALSVEVQTKTIEQEADDDPKLASLLTDLLKDHRLLHDDDIGSSIFSSTTAWDPSKDGSEELANLADYIFKQYSGLQRDTVGCTRTFYRKSLEQLSESAAVYLRDTREVHIESDPLITILREILKKANETSADEATPKSSGKTLGVDYATCVKGNLTSVSNILHKHTSQIKQYLNELNTSLTTARTETRLEHMKLNTEVTDGHSATENRFKEQTGTSRTELLWEVDTIAMLLLTKEQHKEWTELQDCVAVYDNGFVSPGVYAITPLARDPVLVWCSNRWTTLVRREIGDISFDRSAIEYQHGFGNQHADHFVGFRAQYAITDARIYELSLEFRLDVPNATVLSYGYTKFVVYNDVDAVRPTLEVSGIRGLGGLHPSLASELDDFTIGVNHAIFYAKEDSQRCLPMKYCTGEQTTGFFGNDKCYILVFKSNTWSNGSSVCLAENPVCARLDKHLLRSIEMKII